MKLSFISAAAAAAAHVEREVIHVHSPVSIREEGNPTDQDSVRGGNASRHCITVSPQTVCTVHYAKYSSALIN